MGCCYTDDHIAGDHIHMAITICNTGEQQKYRLGKISNHERQCVSGNRNNMASERKNKGSYQQFVI